ncbi:MAG: CDP-glycerol glycerophosphotransferase family protein [Candidatus Algichlamydia australiensis]|nr:CDP-glycerol glycerophosphotransferase family protein [Chlamydiales bacterium]
MKRTCALIFGDNIAYLDHVAPLAALLEIPLVVTESEIFELANRYYPDLVVHHIDWIEVTKRLVPEYDILITNMPAFFLRKLFRMSEMMAGKKILSIWVPHGNSDKHFPFEGLPHETIALIYGNQMEQIFKSRGVYKQIPHVLTVGNYRLTYYERLKNFYDKKISSEVLSHLNREKKTVLYAPTWNDGGDTSTLFVTAPTLIEKLTPKYNLIIKLHPSTSILDMSGLQALMREYGDSTLFLEHYPPVYPLLDLADAYIGDISSIGYDFLHFDKPMFFLQPDEDLPLHQAGLGIEKLDEISQLIENTQSEFSEKRKALYSHAFAKPFEREKLKEIIFSTCEKALEARVL